jgi:hypothetical protein
MSTIAYILGDVLQQLIPKYNCLQDELLQRIQHERLHCWAEVWREPGLALQDVHQPHRLLAGQRLLPSHCQDQQQIGKHFSSLFQQSSQGVVRRGLVVDQQLWQRGQLADPLVDLITPLSHLEEDAESFKGLALSNEKIGRLQTGPVSVILPEAQALA